MSELFSDPIVLDQVHTPLARPTDLVLSLYVEVALKESAKCRFDAALHYVEQYIKDNYTYLSKDTEIKNFDEYDPVLKNNVDRIYIVDVVGSESEFARVTDCTIDIHVYQLRDRITSIGDDDYGDGDRDDHSNFATSVDLPAKTLGN